MRQAATLAELERRDGSAIRLAGAILEKSHTWLDAVAVYLDNRRRDTEQTMRHALEIDVPNHAARIRAMAEIATRLGAEFKGEPKQAVVGAIDEQAQLAVLAGLLCPPGWREHYGKALERILAESSAKLIALEDISLNQKIGQEIEQLQTFLEIVDKQGSGARSRLGLPDVARAGLAGLRMKAAKADATGPTLRALRKAATGETGD